MRWRRTDFDAFISNFDTECRAQPRARLAAWINLAANEGCPDGQKRAVIARVGDDFEGTLGASRERLAGLPEVMSPAAMAEELDAMREGYLAASSSAQKTLLAPQGGASVIRRADAPGDVLANLAGDGHVLFPQLPWYPAAPGASRDRELRFSLDSSNRTIAVHPRDGDDHMFVKMGLPRTQRPEVAGWRNALTRHMYAKFFGLDPVYDDDAIERLDVLHSLVTSARVEEAATRHADLFACLPELAGAVGPTGSYIVRASRPVDSPAEAVLVPYFSVIGARANRPFDVLEALWRTSGRPLVDVASELGQRYLETWLRLWFSERLLLLSPHGQNAFFEVLPGCRIGRVVIKDMRDMDVWSDYERHTSQSQRLQSMDRAYVDMRLRLKPLYHDSASWSDPRAHLAGAAFSFSFHVLRNVVLRGIQTAARGLDPAAGRAVAARFADLVEQAANIQTGSVARLAPTRRWHSATRLLEASKRLRLAWIDVALADAPGTVASAR